MTTIDLANGGQNLDDILVAALERCRITGDVEVAEHVLEALRTLHDRDDAPPNGKNSHAGRPA